MMTKKICFLGLLALMSANHFQAQSFSSKMIEIKEISYPKNPLPTNITNYGIEASDKKNIGPFLSNSDVAATLDFQSFQFTEQNPNFIIRYKASEPFITTTLTPQVNKDGAKEYRFTVKTTMSIQVTVLDQTKSKFFYKKQYKLQDPYVDRSTGQISSLATQQKPEDLHYSVERIVSEEEVGEFFTISEDGSKFRLTESYRKQVLGTQLSRLMLKTAKDLQNQFDLRVNKTSHRYYVLNDIKDEAKSDELYLSIQNIYENIATVEDYYNAKTKVQEHIDFNQNIISEYDATDKKQAKVIWASLFNQALLLNISTEFDKAKELANRAIGFKIRKLVTKSLFNSILNAKDGYNRIFEKDGTKKNIKPSYKGLASNNTSSINSDSPDLNQSPDKIKEIKIDKLEGYVLNEKGEKEFEGTIYIEFAGNKMKKVLNLDTQETTEEPSDDYGKEFIIAYEKKGKTKGKKIKAKESYSFHINETNETYEGFGTEKDAMEKLMSIASLGGGNHKYYLLKYDAEKVKIYEDKTTAFDGTVLKLKKEEKGIKISKTMESSKFLNQMADFYGKCKELKERIKRAEFSNTMDDHIKMADIYKGCVKK